ncbi:MAG TPA: metalloregulator ArsR/SmtB family transcription factor [Candidatus Gracilibacteria bacterium]|nr:metalloregulator ArsR/SmtB family transcription factor [Candidatus Gracilibacteria bacterium]
MTDLCKEIARLGKGIGNENRYRILEALMGGPLTVGEIAEIVSMNQPAVSQNLKVLKSSELVEDKRRGKEVFYSVNVLYMTKLLRKMVMDIEKGKKK